MFLRKLRDIFNTSEDIQNIETLFHLFNIYKAMLSLGDTKIIECLLSQEYYLDTFGALECNYQTYLIIDIDDPDLYNVSPTGKRNLNVEADSS